MLLQCFPNVLKLIKSGSKKTWKTSTSEPNVYLSHSSEHDVARSHRWLFLQLWFSQSDWCECVCVTASLNQRVCVCANAGCWIWMPPSPASVWWVEPVSSAGHTHAVQIQCCGNTPPHFTPCLTLPFPVACSVNLSGCVYVLLRVSPNGRQRLPVLEVMWQGMVVRCTGVHSVCECVCVFMCV